MNAKTEKTFKRNCEYLARKICRQTQIVVLHIHYKEYLHNVYKDNESCHCYDNSERRLGCSEISKCKYKNRIQVKMVTFTMSGMTNEQKNRINKILRTNVQYKKRENGCIEIVFNVNPCTSILVR